MLNNCTLEMWCRKVFVMWHFKSWTGSRGEGTTPIWFLIHCKYRTDAFLPEVDWEVPTYQFFHSQTEKQQQMWHMFILWHKVWLGLSLLCLHVVGPCVGQNIAGKCLYPFHKVGGRKAQEESLKQGWGFLHIVSVCAVTLDMQESLNAWVR